MAATTISQEEFLAWKAQVEAEISAQNTKIATLESLLLQAIANTPKVSSSSRPKPCLPDPDKLGAQLQYDTFGPEIEVKIEIDCEAITNVPFSELDSSETAHKTLFFYVYNRLESKIKAMVLPLLLTAKTTKYRYTDLLAHFDRVWETPNKKKLARDKLLNFMMSSTEAFASALSRFERLLHEAEAADWSDDLKIMHLRNGFGASSSLEKALSFQLVVPDKYNDFVQACHKLSGRSSSNYNNNGGGNHNYNKPTTSGGAPMDLSQLQPLNQIQGPSQFRTYGSGSTDPAGIKNISMLKRLNESDTE